MEWRGRWNEVGWELGCGPGTGKLVRRMMHLNLTTYRAVDPAMPAGDLAAVEKQTRSRLSTGAEACALKAAKACTMHCAMCPARTLHPAPIVLCIPASAKLQGAGQHLLACMP